jgi:hypothetical protein
MPVIQCGCGRRRVAHPDADVESRTQTQICLGGGSAQPSGAVLYGTTSHTSISSTEINLTVRICPAAGG